MEQEILVEERKDEEEEKKKKTGTMCVTSYEDSYSRICLVKKDHKFKAKSMWGHDIYPQLEI